MLSLFLGDPLYLIEERTFLKSVVKYLLNPTKRGRAGCYMKWEAMVTRTHRRSNIAVRLESLNHTIREKAGGVYFNW